MQIKAYDVLGKTGITKPQLVLTGTIVSFQYISPGFLDIYAVFDPELDVPPTTSLKGEIARPFD